MLRRLTMVMVLMVSSNTGAEGTDTTATIRAWIGRDQVITADLTPGRVIGLEDLDGLAEVVPPALLQQLRFPGVAIEIQATGDLAPHAVYREATAAHASKTALAPDGSIAGYVAGQPFTHERIISASPQEAGLMVAWNNVHRWDYFGYRTQAVTSYYLMPGKQESNPDLPVFMSGGGAIVRSINVFFHRVYLSHLPMLADQGYRVDVSGGDELLYKDYLEFTEPFDLAGGRLVIERSLDPHEEDQVNSYLPQERRVRRLSARERADSWMGTDFTLDDFEGFSGRVLDYTWTLLGRKSVLAVADSRRDAPHFFGPLSNIPHGQWQLRECYVVEAVPTWDGHPYGGRIMFVDEQTSQVRLALVVDHDDRLWKIFIPLYSWPDAAGKRTPSQTASQFKGNVGIDLVNGRSTVSRGTNTDHPVMEAAKIRRMFSASSLGGGRGGRTRPAPRCELGRAPCMSERRPEPAMGCCSKPVTAV